MFLAETAMIGPGTSIRPDPWWRTGALPCPRSVGRVEVTRDVDVAREVCRDSVTGVAYACAQLACPRLVARGVLFAHEGIFKP